MTQLRIRIAIGQPKLLDFGMAKLVVETHDPTQTVDPLLTPSYASPEQLSGARAVGELEATTSLPLVDGRRQDAECLVLACSSQTATSQ